MDEDQTRVMTLAQSLQAQDERVHFLVVVQGEGLGERHVIAREGVVVGRKEPADIVLADSEISRAHCRLGVRDEALWVADLGSTNGTFVDGERVTDAVVVPVGAIVQIGRLSLKYEWRSRREWLQTDELDRDLEKASAYIHALLPERIAEGPVLADWFFRPSAKLGGDAFGYGALPGGKFAAYLVDVSGHGAGAAMHSVAVMNALRQRTSSQGDATTPGEVLRALNDMFPMESHAGMYFTIWYGVFDPAERALEYASAGHHPAFLVPADRSEAAPLRTRNPMIGAAPGVTFKSDKVEVPAGACVHLFSDGVFEIVTSDGLQWRLQDFLPLLLKPSVSGVGECRRLFDEVTRVAGPNGFDDDFSMVVLTFG